jgi:hypothetical protein
VFLSGYRTPGQSDCRKIGDWEKIDDLFGYALTVGQLPRGASPVFSATSTPAACSSTRRLVPG